MTDFGRTPWGRGWLRLAQPISITRPNPQLPPARGLATDGRVRELDLAPGRITARVEDGPGHRVSIAFPVWEVLPEITDPDPPDELVDRLHLAGTPVAPAPDQLDASCGCERRDGRCRHVLAVLLETARRADESPQVALGLRGLRRAAVPPDRSRIRVEDLDVAGFWTPGGGAAGAGQVP